MCNTTASEGLSKDTVYPGTAEECPEADKLTTLTAKQWAQGASHCPQYKLYLRQSSCLLAVSSQTSRVSSRWCPLLPPEWAANTGITGPTIKVRANVKTNIRFEFTCKRILQVPSAVSCYGGQCMYRIFDTTSAIDLKLAVKFIGQ